MDPALSPQDSPPSPPAPQVQRPTAWTVNFPNHQPPQPPAPAVAPAPAFAPSTHTAGAARAKNVVLGLVAVLILLPIVAVFALVALGQTVQQSAADISRADAPVALAFDDPAVPSGAEYYVDSDEVFSVWIDPAWSEPTVQRNEFNGTEVTLWWLDEYSTSTFRASVNVTYGRQPAGATLDRVTEAELDLSRTLISISNVDQRDQVIDGATVRVLSYDGTIEGVALTFVSAFRLDGDVVRMATVSAPREFASVAQAEVVPYLLTVSGTGTTG